MNKQLQKFFAILLIASFSASAQQPGSIDLTFNPMDIGYDQFDGTNDVVTTMVRQTDGKILISGFFTICNGVSSNRIARLNPDGSIDESFNPGTGANNQVRAIALLPDGKILIGGNFTQFNGVSVNRIARLNADGSLDTNFNPGTGANIGTIRSISVFANGKILVAGDFTSFNGVAINRIARLDSNGSLDTSFDPGTGANFLVVNTLILPDGKIMIGGFFTVFDNVPRNYIARLNSNGSLDTSFDPGEGPNSRVYNIVNQNDGKLLIAGEFTEISSVSCNRIARLNADGSLDTDFDPGTGANWWAMDILLQDDGKMMLTGGFTHFNDLPHTGVVRLNSDGSLDQSFQSLASSGAMYSIVSSSDNTFVAAGTFAIYGGAARKNLVSIHDDGSLDSSMFSNLGTGANGPVFDLKPDHQGNVIIGGGFTAYNGVSLSYFARINQDGEVDNVFDTGEGPNSLVRRIFIQPDGKILINGFFTSYNGVFVYNLARINPDGSLDPSFNLGAGPNGQINSMGLFPDGKILIAGTFTEYDNVPRNSIARLNADGSLDTSFDPGTGANNHIWTSQIQSDNKIVIAGSFTTFNNEEANYLARLNYDGSIDDNFNTGSGANNFIYSAVLLSDGKIIIAGSFTMFNGQSAIRIARLLTDGTLDPEFSSGSGPSQFVDLARIAADGKILIAGGFSSYNGTEVIRIARLHPDGSLDASFNPEDGANNTIMAMELQPDNKILIGGNFTAYYSTGRNRLARIHGGPATFIKDISKTDALFIFPNPASTHFTIDLKKEYSNILVEIYDLTGKMVQSKQDAKLRYLNFDITNLPVGLYNVRIFADETHNVFKLVKD